MIEIASLLIGNLLGMWRKSQQERSNQMLEMARISSQSRNDAFNRSQADDAFTRWWRVPVRPIITYIGVLSFFALPYLALFTDLNINMEVCNNVSGLWAWLTSSQGEFCEFVSLSNGVVWTKQHSVVALSITGYWFGSR